MKKVLLITALRWISTAQLAMAFHDLGWQVEAVCPHGHPMSLTRAVRRTYAFNAILPRRSSRAGLLQARPDLVVAVDDLAAAHLRSLKAHAFGNPSAEARSLDDLLTRSLGPHGSYPFLESRAAFAALAREEAVTTPDSISPRNKAEFAASLQSSKYPLVLKTDGTSGGEGVRIVATEAEALQQYKLLCRPLSTSGVALRAGLDRNMNVLTPWVLRKRRTVSLQAFVCGRDANMAIACWRGKVLASICVEVLHTRRRNGPSAVIRVIENQAMEQAAMKVVQRLELSGLCGLDFVFDDETGVPYLIEINGRATPTCHLALGPGRDLVAALCSAVSGQPEPDRPGITQNPILALFPHAWQIDTGSEFLADAYRDLPAHEPTLVQSALSRRPRVTRAQLDRLCSRFHPGWLASPRSSSAEPPR